MTVQKNSLVFAFDLDGTLCSNSDGYYENAEPFLKRIAHVNSLSKNGHTIIVFTARGATSGRDLRQFTENQLKTWGVQYDSLIMGKPHFDYLIDDKAIDSESYFSKLNLD